MFRDAGHELQVYCDYAGRVLKVASTAPLLPGFLGTWREVAQFKNREEFIRSSFYRRVTNEDVQEMIEWFWEDLRSEDTSSQSPSI